MRRREFIGGAVATSVSLPAQVSAQGPGKVFRVSVLTPQHSTEPTTLQREPFERGLRELGWRPGTDIVIEYGYGEGSIERLVELARDLVRRDVDLFVTRGAAATRAARQATTTVPIVMAVVPDPLREGFVASLARPGANITGFAWLAHEPLEAKQLELLKEAVPSLTRVAVLENPATSVRQIAQALDAAARALGLAIDAFQVQSSSSLVEVFDVIARSGAQGLLIRADPQILEANHKQVGSLALTHRLPGIHSWRHFLEAGGLMAYGPNLYDLHRRSATYVDKILKGTAPADLPVEQPTRFDLGLNLKTANALGLTIPPTLLARADEVIE